MIRKVQLSRYKLLFSLTLFCDKSYSSFKKIKQMWINENEI